MKLKKLFVDIETSQALIWTDEEFENVTRYFESQFPEISWIEVYHIDESVQKHDVLKRNSAGEWTFHEISWSI